MKKKIIFGLISVFLSSTLLFSCNKTDDNNTSSTSVDYAYAYCSRYYDTSSGNYGSFSIKALDNEELETNFDDLSKFKLGDAFTNMKLEKVIYEESSNCTNFYISGPLTYGNSGTIEGNGIIKEKSVKVNIPISEASASSDNIIYKGLDEQKVEIVLTNACFNKNIKTSDFTLTGAAKNMTVKSVACETYIDDDGDEQLSSIATLTLTGDSNGSDYAYISISENATTYNKDINLALKTDFCGAYILNDYIDTYSLIDIINIQASNIEFDSSIKVEDISFDGVLKNYAKVKNVERINSQLLNVTLEFPYTYINPNNESSIGYIRFNENTTTSKKEVICTAVVGAPKIKSDIKINGKEVSMKFTIENNEWNLLDFYPFTVCYPDGTEIIVGNTDVINTDEELTIKFNLPDNCSGILYFTLPDAYKVVSSSGESNNVSIKTIFYV